MPVREALTAMHAEIAGWRRDFHAHPELGYDTHRTARAVAAALRRFGCDAVVEGVGRSGVVGLIHGRAKTSGRVVALRADMDALPMQEATGLAWASKTPGRMHGCGHDGHTAMLLGAAQYLAQTRAFDGCVVLVFQPAEEDGAGARAMLDNGLLTRFGVDEIYGMHNAPGLPVGAFALRSGPFYAAIDDFAIEVIGRGGHAAYPHETVDPTVTGCHLVLALQTIAARNADPQCPLVVSVTGFHSGGDASNVIPETVRLRGTVRSFDPTLRALAEARLKHIATGTAALFGARAQVDWEPGYPCLVNPAAQTRFAAQAAARVSEIVAADCPAIMAGEDFAYFLEACPGAFIHVGVGEGAGLHNPHYDFNDEAIPFGASYWVDLVELRLSAS